MLVGTVLEPGALPSPDLRFGDKVRVLVASANGSADDPSKIVTEAVVWRVWGSAAGSGSRRAVTLAVPEAASIAVGEAAARNSIRLLVVPNGRVNDPPGWPTTIDTPVVFPAAGVVATTNASPAQADPLADPTATPITVAEPAVK